MAWRNRSYEAPFELKVVEYAKSESEVKVVIILTTDYL